MKAGNLPAAVADVNEVRARVNARLIEEHELDIDFLLDERTRELLGGGAKIYDSISHGVGI